MEVPELKIFQKTDFGRILRILEILFFWNGLFRDQGVD
jgi:hypothetical protein